jgi:PAS domain S-box-containing protein
MAQLEEARDNQINQDKATGQLSVPRFPSFRRRRGEKPGESPAKTYPSLAGAYKALADSVAEAVITTDGDFLITDWSKAAEIIYGWKAEEVIGQKRSEIIPALLPDGNLWDESLALTAEHSQWEGEVFQRNRTKDRLVIHSTVRVSREEKGDVTALTFINRNLTEEKIMAEKLALSEAEFKALADTIPELAWLADEHGQTYWYNRRWYDYTGSSLGEMAGAGWQKVHNPDYLPRLMKRIGQAFKEGKPWEDVFPIKGKDGKYRMFYTRAVPIHDQKGKVIRWLGTNTDINEVGDIRKEKKEWEDKYRSLIENIEEGFAYFEMVLEDAGALQDLRLIEANGAFERAVGLARGTSPGTAVSALLPFEARKLFEQVTRAVSEAKAQRFEWHNSQNDRRFKATAYIPKAGFAVVLIRQYI